MRTAPTNWPKDRRFLVKVYSQYWSLRERKYKRSGAVVREVWWVERRARFEFWCGNIMTQTTDSLIIGHVLAWCEIPGALQ